MQIRLKAGNIGRMVKRSIPAKYTKEHEKGRREAIPFCTSRIFSERKKRLIFLFFLFGLLIPFLMNAISFEAYVDKSKIGTKDILKLTLEISGDDVNKVSQPKLPKIKNFSQRSVSSSSSSSMSIVNGRMTSEVTKEYIYSLQPQKAGRFIIPPITIRVKNKNYTTDTIQINVVDGSTQPAPPTSRRLNKASKDSDNISDNLFLKVILSKRNVYKDEPIIVEYKLYTRYDVSNLSFGNDPSFAGFWKEDIFIPKSVQFDREVSDGVMYNVMLMRSLALFPTETGKQKLPALELLVDIRTQSQSFFDFGSSKRYTIKSEPKTIFVKELPVNGKPENFTNAIGDFKINSSISKDEVKVGDSFTYTLEITGKGNLNKFDIPTLPEVGNLRFLDPEISNQINKNKVSGSKTIKYLVIAQEKGNFEIPSISFSYFDINRKTYRTKRTDKYPLTVLEGQGTFIRSSTAQSIVRKEGSDIGFIKTEAELINKEILINKFSFWFIWFISLLLIPAALIYSKEQRKLAVNIDYVRQKKAKKILNKYLKRASVEAENESINFYTAAQNGLSSYLSDKLRIPRGSVSDDILLRLKTKHINDEVYDKVKTLFDKCNQARFMPGGFSKEQIREDYNLLQDAVSELSKRFR